MIAVQPVAHGTAEQLARIRHFRGLDLPDAHELDPVARFLIGRVTDPAEVLEQITDELDQLWSLITEDFDDDQLDELTDHDWCQHSFATQQQEADHRHSMTVSRLVYAIEGHISLHRIIRAENERPVRTAAPGHPFAAIFDGTVDTRHRVNDGDITEYLRQKAELA